MCVCVCVCACVRVRALFYLFRDQMVCSAQRYAILTLSQIPNTFKNTPIPQLELV